MKITIENTEVDAKKAIFIIKDDKDQILASISDGLSYAEAIELLGTLSLHVLEVFKKLYPNGTEDMYQDYNFMASNVLATFVPDKELRPDLTLEAIQRMENQLIEEKYSKVNREQRRAAQKHINSVKKHYAKKVR